MRNIKIGCVIPFPNDATSYYRALGPLAHLRRVHGIDFEIIEKADWYTVSRFDIVFIQRPATAEHMRLMAICEQYGVPTWIDYDDDVFSVPIENRAYFHYARADHRGQIMNMIKRASIVTVSTNKLKQVFGRLSKHVTHIPNAKDPIFFSDVKVPRRNKKIVWRGTDSHVGDLLEFKDEIVQVMKENPEWGITFMGYVPFFISDEIKAQVEFKLCGNVLDFMREFHKERAAFTIVPLKPNDFNESKSMIAWLESTIVGSACLAPAFEEWRRPGCSHYTSKKGFADAMRAMMRSFEKDPSELEDDVLLSQEYVKETLTLTQTNETRMVVIQELLKLNAERRMMRVGWRYEPETGEQTPSPDILGHTSPEMTESAPETCTPSPESANPTEASTDGPRTDPGETGPLGMTEDEPKPSFPSPAPESTTAPRPI